MKLIFAIIQKKVIKVSVSYSVCYDILAIDDHLSIFNLI